MPHPFQLGQAVRLVSPLAVHQGGAGDFVVVGRNELDGDEPNYLIESTSDQRRRREPHSRLAAIIRAARD